MQQHNNLSQIAHNYDAFIIDLWGVIHDGRSLYDGVLDCLEHLKNNNKTIIFLSNAPRRAIRAIEGLQNLGIPDNLYDHVITSGEVTFENINNNNIKPGQIYYMISPERDIALLDETTKQRTNNISQADFVVVTGFDHDDSKLDDIMEQLIKCHQHNLHMICANPDMIIVRQDGTRPLCAGIIAQEYSQMGGQVTHFGKPYPQVYNKALEILSSTNKQQIACIGDNLETDIKGANNAKLDSYLIAGGILGEKLGITHGQQPNPEKLQTICQKYNATPTGTLPAFIWD